MTTCSGGLSATALTRFHKWAGGVLLGNPPCLAERRREVIPWCTVHHSSSWDPETEETAPLLKFWVPLAAGPAAEKKKTKQRILHPALLRGREWCGHHLPTSSSLHLWVARLRASCTCACRRVWRGPGRAGRSVCDRLTTPHGGRLLPRRGSGGGHRGAPTATSRLRGCSRSGSSRGFHPAHDVLDRLSLLLCCRKLLAQLSTASPKRPVCDTGAFRNWTFSAPSCQWDTARDGAPGPQAWTSHDPETVRSPSSLGARGPSQHAAHVELPGRAHPRAGLSVLWPDGPAVTPWRVGQKPPPHRLYKHCQWGLTSITGPWGETRFTPQSGSDCWTQLHGHRPLHRGDARVPQSGSTIEGGEGGGATRFISGSKRCLPWPCKLLMHFRKEWHRRGALKTSATPPPEKPLVQPRRVGTRWRIPHEPDVLGGPGKHSRHLWVWLGQRYHTRRGQRSRVVIPGERGLALRCSDRHLVIREAPKERWGTPLSRGPRPNQRYPAGCGVPEGWEPPLGKPSP